MDQLHQYADEDLRVLALVYSMKLTEKIDEYEQKSQVLHTDVYRQELAKGDARMAKALEKLTAGEIVAGSKDAAIAEAVAYTVRFAIDYFDVRRWSDED